MSALLEITGLSLRIGGTPVLEDVSLTVGAGERVGLIGASGSGKSMTALAVMGLLPERSRTTGSVMLGGRELLGRDERRIASLRGAEMAMVFQEPMTALDPLMPVGRQVAEVVRLHRRVTAAAARSAALRLLEAVQLPRAATLFRVYPHQLSGGQRQRVVLAMAMVNNPGLLICDEPTTALDVTVQAAVLDLLRGLVTEHQTSLLFITHDLAVVSQMCERVVVMRAGRVVETGDAAQVFARPAHPYTAGLLAVSDLTTVPPRSRLTAPAEGGGP
ncbi:MAG: ATP-binding cassette domain-containing protein [Streptosporangiales bacterium]|nr:ATP-binding cassette domain-containing protein [Streptosporangiales bacterium]